MYTVVPIITLLSVSEHLIFKEGSEKFGLLLFIPLMVHRVTPILLYISR